MTSLAIKTSLPSLVLGENEELSGRVRAIHESIARRAYQLFDGRGRFDGHDLEDWLKAESEILLPIGVNTYEFEDDLITRALLPLPTAEDIEVQVEERRIIISDRAASNVNGGENANSRKRVCRTISLPEPVDWTNAAVTFKEGILEITVSKLTTSVLSA